MADWSDFWSSDWPILYIFIICQQKNDKSKWESIKTWTLINRKKEMFTELNLSRTFFENLDIKKSAKYVVLE